MSRSVLPRWVDNPDGRTLLAAIRLEQPDCFFVARDAWTNGRSPKYKGANANALRRMWKVARDAALDVDPELFSEIVRSEPDALIEALLNEQTVPYTPFEIDLREDGGRVAA